MPADPGPEPTPAADDVTPAPPTRDHPAPRIRSEAHVFSILSQFAVMQIVLAFAGVVRNKVMAFRLGPAAFGEFAQLTAVAAVATAVVSFGMGVGVSRNAARASTEGERQDQLANANGIVLGLAFVALTLGALLLASGRLLPMVGLEVHPAMVIAAAVVMAAIPFEAVKNDYLALLQGILDVRGVATSRSVAVVLVTVLAVPLVWYAGLIGAAVQSLLLAVFVAVLLGWRCAVLGYRPLRVRLDPSLVATLASFGIVSMASGFAQVFADTAVRARLIAAAGAAANGILQAPYMLSEMLKGVVLASIGSVALATIAATREREQISAEVDRLLNVILPVGASALGLLGLLGAPVLALLYSPQFVAGTRLFPFLLSADLLLTFVWVVGAPLLAHGDRALWLALDLVYAALRWGVASLLMARLEAVSVVVGYLAAVAVHLSLTLAVYRFRYRLELKPRHFVRLAFGVALVACLSVAGASAPTSVPAAAVGLAAWAAYTVHHARRTGLLAVLRRRLQKA